MKKGIKNDHLQIYIPALVTTIIEGVTPLKLVRISKESYQIRPILFTKGKLVQLESNGTYIGYSVIDLENNKKPYEKDRVYDFYANDDKNTYSDPTSEVVKVYTPKKLEKNT